MGLAGRGAKKVAILVCREAVGVDEGAHGHQESAEDSPQRM